MTEGALRPAPSLSWRAELLSRRRRDEIVAQLALQPVPNLLLLDMADSVGRRIPPTEVAPHVLIARAEGRIGAIMALRPSVVLASDFEPGAIEAFIPHFESLESGLVKSASGGVDVLWQQLRAKGRRALIDRIEDARFVEPASARLDDPDPELLLRPAREGDLEALVTAARASLREEGRPDPFDGDPIGFRRWVWGRFPRARVVELDGRVVFVGYADVRRAEGWLVQGVYTWPHYRRRGIARIGMSGIVREAFEAGAAHVQLAVVEGNAAGMQLYDRLGFTSFEKLRTILFR